MLITFNRPAESRQVLEALRAVRPLRLFVANDGPRPTRPLDAPRCTEVRSLVTQLVDWPCEVKTLYQDENLGCRRGVQAALSWFFSQVDEGIILEDDIVPDPSFFDYQAELLERYRHDRRVMCISGHQSQGQAPWPESYRFSRFAAIWGWGTWKRVWDEYEPLVASYFQPGAPEALRRVLKKPQLFSWWHQHLHIVAEGRLDTWDIQFCYHLLKHNGLCAVPRASVIRNIGFGSDATHTQGDGGDGGQPPAVPLTFPLVHPVRLQADRWYDLRHARAHFWNRDVTLWWKVVKLVKGLKRSLLAK